MPVLTQQDFAQKAGVSPAAISTAIRRHTLVKASERGGIDTEHPLAVAYLSRRSVSAPTHHDGKGGGPIVGGAVPAVRDSDDDPNEPTEADLASESKKLHNKLIKKKIRREDIRIKSEEGKNIPYHVAERFTRALDASLDENFRQFDQRCGEALRDIARNNDDPTAFMLALRAEIESAVKTCISTANRELERMAGAQE